MRQTFHRLAGLFGLSWALLGCLPALAQEAIWDPPEIARLAEKSARMAQMLSQLTELANDGNDLFDRIGRPGAFARLAVPRSDRLDGLTGLTAEIGAATATIGLSQQAPSGTFSNAKILVDVLAAGADGSNPVTERAGYRQRLDVLQRSAAIDGYALAMHLREGLSASPQSAALLIDQASAAVDLRDDVRANTAVLMAIFGQLGGIKATLASILEIQATRRLAASSNAVLVK